MKVKVYLGSELVKTWECDSYEVIFENGYENVYVEKDGIRRKAVSAGNFGYDCWGYEVER